MRNRKFFNKKVLGYFKKFWGILGYFLRKKASTICGNKEGDANDRRNYFHHYKWENSCHT